MGHFTELAGNMSASQRAILHRCLASRGICIEFDREVSFIHERFEQVARQCPDRLALKTTERSMTYDALNRTANRLAHAIRRQSRDDQETVALWLPHGIPLIVGMLGVWKAGKIWTRVDPSLPQERIAYMLQDALAGVIVTTASHDFSSHAWRQNGMPMVHVDNLDTELSDENLDLTIAPDTPAYIRYTSGSTGKPKGSIKTHASFLRGFNESLLGMEDRVVCLDPGLSGLFHGACVYPISVKQDGLAHVAKVLMQEDITVYLSVATTFRHFIGTLTGHEAFPKLRLIMLHGELMYTRDVELYKKHFAPHCVLVNGLASTEAGGIARYLIDHETQITGDIVPVGYPVADNEILLLDEAGHEVADGEIGEIAVRSAYLSPGYWRRPDLTRTAFLPDPQGGPQYLYHTGDLGRRLPDGSLVLVERKDFQIKIRGNRVEVAEIEMVLLEHPDVKEAVVVNRQDGTPAAADFDAGVRLVAYIVPAATPAPTISALRQALAKKLPDYMMPAAFVMLDALPLTATGKVNRRALPAPARVRPNLETAFVAPRTPVETALAQLWAELLGLQEVGIHDTFLDLGGDSLRATQVMSRVIHTFKVELPLRALFESPTVASMAVIITQGQANQAQDIEGLLAELEALRDRAE